MLKDNGFYDIYGQMKKVLKDAHHIYSAMTLTPMPLNTLMLGNNRVIKYPPHKKSSTAKTSNINGI